MAQNLCGHCGREGTLHELEPWITLGSRTSVEPNAPSDPESITIDRRLQVWKCSVCGEPTLRQYYWIDEYNDPEYAWDTEQTLYPREHDVTDLPERVAMRYSEMMQVLFQPEAFSVGAGKVLEAVCTERGIANGPLADRLRELAQRGKLPGPLAKQAQLIRRYRNIGGHDDDQEITKDDVTVIRGFVESLLDYLYWGPAKYERAVAAFEERTAKRDGPEVSSDGQPDQTPQDG
jgi:hypothetical protein